MLKNLPEIKERPVLNTTFVPTTFMGEPRTLDLTTLIWWIKRTPECIGIIKRIATDILTPYHFKAIEEKTKGRPKSAKTREDRVNDFEKRNFLRQKLLANIMDWIMTGDGYLWKGKLSDNQIKEIAIKHYKSYGIEFKEGIDVKQFFDEDFNGVSAIESVPSSMVRIDHDEFKITNYLQLSRISPGKNRIFSTEEIIHSKFMELDGGVYGFSPFEASFVPIMTINGISDYSYNYFANGVKLDRAWLFTGNPNQTYIDKFEETLQKYKQVRNAHGDIIVSGADNIEMKNLNEANEDMEYRKLAIHTVGRLAFAFNMPADILSSILGVDISGTGIGSDIEDAGYNRNIENAQKYWEELLNNQMFIPDFKVEIFFQRNFRQDQIRQVQYQIQATTLAEFLFKHEWPVNDDYYNHLLQIPKRFQTDGEIKKIVEEPMGVGFTPPVKGGNAQKLSDKKKAEQKPQERINPPTGS